MKSKSPAEKMLLVLPEAFNSAGGIQMFCRALCLAAGKWAQTNDANVSAVVLNDIGAPDKHYVNGGFASYFGAGKRKPKFIRHFLSKVLTSRYDWIIFGHVSLSPLALLARRLNPHAKICVIAYGIEVWRPLSRIECRALRQADVVLAISDFTKSELLKHSAIPAEKIKIFPCSLDPHWKPDLPGPTLEKTSRVLLSVTRMQKEDRYKGIDNVIRSLPAVVQEVGPVEYRVIGVGGDVPRLRALAAGLGVERYVNFIGSVSDSDLREHYSACSLFVMPSRKEGFGIVFLEAMAYGKPVIGGAHGGTPSVINDEETGLLVDNSDVDGIADSIIRLLGDSGMRNRFGDAGYERLMSEFTFDSFSRNFENVFS